MSAKWEKVAIENIYLDLYDGPHATPKPSDEGPVFLGIKNITDDGRLDLSEIKHISEKDFPKWTKRVTPRPGDIVFTYEATLNRYAVIPESFRGCLGRRVALIRPDPTKVDTRFLHHYFFGKEWRATIAQNMIPGSTVDRIPLIHFPKFEVSLPPLPTQRKIAAVLSAYDDLLENNTRRIAVLEEMARLLYQEWFVRFRFPGHEDAAMVDSELGPVPEEWEISSLSELFPSDKTVVKTGPFGSKLHAYDYRDTGVPLILVKHVKNGRIVEEDMPLVGEHKLDELQVYRLQAGDIVVTRVGYVGEVAYVHKHHQDWLFSGQMLRVRIRSLGLIHPRFLVQYYLTPTFKKMIENFAVGATRLSLNTTILSSMPLLIPPDELQRAFVDYVTPIDEAIQNLSRRTSVLRRTRDLLRPRLVSGQVDVSALEIDVGGLDQ